MRMLIKASSIDSAKREAMAMALLTIGVRITTLFLNRTTGNPRVGL